jgi:cell division protein FtsA
MRKGVVVDVDDVIKSIALAVEEAEKSSGVPVEHAYIGIGGNHITSQKSKGVIAVSRADGEVSADDVSRVINASQALSLPSNREILHVIPLSFVVDGQENIKDPVGMSGVRLEVESLIIEGSVPFIKNLTKCVYQAGVEVDDVILSPLAAARASLTKRQKDLGVISIDIGGGTTGLAVFSEGDLLHTSIIPVGAAHITNDIAIGLRTSIEVAEKVKLEYGSALPSEIKKRDQVDLADIEEGEEDLVSRYQISRIIEARMSEIFSLVNDELNKIDQAGLLPAGAVLTGGGAKMPGAVDVAKRILKLPAQVGFPIGLGGMVDKVDEPSCAVPVGLLMWGMDEDGARTQVKSGMFSQMKFVSGSMGKVKKWLKTFLP